MFIEIIVKILYTKRKRMGISMKRLKCIFLFTVMLITFGFNVLAYADTVNGDDVMLNFNVTSSGSIKVYISESDNEVGDLLLDGPTRYLNFVKQNVSLKPGKTYYLHILVHDANNDSPGFAGKFQLNKKSLQFENKGQVLNTNVKDFRVSTTAFGENYIQPTEAPDGHRVTTYDPYNNVFKDSKWIWTNQGKDSMCTRYFSTKIMPINQVQEDPTLIAEAVPNDKSIVLTWNSIPNTISYSVLRSVTSGGPYTVIATDTTTTSFEDKDVDQGTTYYYTINSRLSDTKSINSKEVSATLLRPKPSKIKVVLKPNEKIQLSVDDNLDENTNMIWESSDISVAEVDNKGKVTALKPGESTIQVRSLDGTYTETISVLVIENADDYRLAVDLKVDEIRRLTVDDFTETVKAFWTSLDPSIATVSSKGIVTAKSKGLALIIAKDSEGTILGQMYIRVR